MKHMVFGLKLWHVAAVIALLSLSVLLYLALAGSRVWPRGDVINRITSFTGTPIEASGVASVPGSDGVLIVDNGRNGQVFWMQLDAEGKQAGPIKTIPIGVNIEDIEGITTDGKYFYVVSSLSRPKAISSAGLVRFRFDPKSQLVSEVSPITELKDYLVNNVTELREESDRKAKEGGLNIEGLAWDPKKNRLLIGLRSPLADGKALVVPLKLRATAGAFAVENLEVVGGRAIQLPIGGIGIRGIEFDATANLFKLISGATEDQTQTDFGLWEWNGDDAKPVLRETSKFDRRLKPEGVARVNSGGRNFTIIVYDAGGYTTLN
jgi:hypothetical protein